MPSKSRKAKVAIGEIITGNAYYSQWIDLGSYDFLTVALDTGNAMQLRGATVEPTEAGNETPSDANTVQIQNLAGTLYVAAANATTLFDSPLPRWVALRNAAAGNANLVSVTLGRKIG